MESAALPVSPHFFSLHKARQLLHTLQGEWGDIPRAYVGDVRDPLLRTENLSPLYTSEQGIIFKLK